MVLMRWLGGILGVLGWVLSVHAADARNLSVGAAGEKRVALVIGNDRYVGVKPLEKAVNDAKAMERALQQSGFRTHSVVNGSRRDMNAAINRFVDDVAGGGIGVFFYAGHGVQLANQNFLIPVDVQGIEREADVADQSISLQTVQDKLADAKAKFTLLVIDACRDNPLPRKAGRSVGGTRGLAQASSAEGQIVVFSAGANQQALDKLRPGDTNPNGVFTREFLPWVAKPGVTIREAVLGVRSAVRARAKSVDHEQFPAIYDQAEGDFYFNPGQGQVARPAPAAIPVDPVAVEIEFWNGVKDSRNPDELRAYLGQYPNGRFAALARARIAAIESERRPQLAVAAPSPVSATPSPQLRPESGLKLRVQGTHPAKDRRHVEFLDVVKNINGLSQGALDIVPLPNGAVVRSFDILGAVAKRILDAGWVSPGFFYGADNAFAAVEGLPFGLDQGGYIAWRGNGHVAALVDRLYRQHGVVGIACGVTAPHGDIWTKKPITKMADFQGLKLRATGIQIELFKNVGAAVNPLPGGEIVPALDRGLLDAATYLDPQTDLLYAFPDVAKILMLGQLHGARGLDLVINAKLWDGISPVARSAVTSACRTNLEKMAADNVRIATVAMAEIMKSVKVYNLPQKVIAELGSAWKEVRAENMRKNQRFSDLVESMAPYEVKKTRPDIADYGIPRVVGGRPGG